MQPSSATAGMDSHQIEPELLRPAPRHVERNKDNHLGFTVKKLTAILLIILCLAFVGWAAFVTLVLALGQNVPGRITGRHETVSRNALRRGPSTFYSLDYSYHAAGKSYSFTQGVGPDNYSRYGIGSPIAVRVFPRQPGLMPLLVLPGFTPANHMRAVWSLPRYGLLLLTILCVHLMISYYVAPRTARRLVVSGVPVPGRIGRKEVRGEDTYILHYDYSPAAGSSADAASASSMATAGTAGSMPSPPIMLPLSRTMDVTYEAHDSATVGDVVTVLYDPHKPWRSLIYRYAPFTVAS